MTEPDDDKLKDELLNIARRAMSLSRGLRQEGVATINRARDLKQVAADEALKPRRVGKCLDRLREELQRSKTYCADQSTASEFQDLILRCIACDPRESFKANENPLTTSYSILSLILSIFIGATVGALSYWLFLPFEIPMLEENGVATEKLADLIKFIGALLLIPLAGLFWLGSPSVLMGIVFEILGRPTKAIKWVCISLGILTSAATGILLFVR